MQHNLSLTSALCGDAIRYPAGVNASQVKELLCAANLTEIQAELQDMLDLDAFLAEVRADTHTHTPHTHSLSLSHTHTHRAPSVKQT